MHDQLRHRLFIGCFLAGLALPLGLLVVLSLGKQWIFPDLLPRVWTLDHWLSLLRGGSELRYGLGLSLLLATLEASLATAAGFWASRQVARSRQRRAGIRAAYAPYVLSPVLYAVLLQYFFIRLGWAGQLGGVLAGQFLLTFPFALIVLQSFWNPSVFELEATGATLGASRGQVFARLLLPMAAPLLGLCFFQCFLISWFEFGLTSLLGLGQVKTLPVQVYQFVLEANVHYAALASLLLLFPPLLLLLINRRLLRGGLLAGTGGEEAPST